MGEPFYDLSRTTGYEQMLKQFNKKEKHDAESTVPYRIIKWPTQVIIWPTLLGCLNNWQMAVFGWVRKGGPI